MKIFNKKVILSIMLVVLLAPATVSAGVYFMEAEDEVAGAGDLVRPCFIDYPFTTCPSGKTPQNFCPTDSRYFKSCGCDTSVYKYTASNCIDNKTLGGNVCDGKYDTCGCDAKYQYTTSNCTGGKALGGNTCDGKYETCGCDAAYSKTCNMDNLVPTDASDSCDGKYKSCKCPTSYVTCDNGGEVGADKCTEENGTVKWSECKPNACPSGTTDYSGLGSNLSLIVSSSEIQNVGTKKCVSNNYCSKLGFGAASEFSTTVSIVKCPLDTSKVYNNTPSGNTGPCIPAEEVCRVNCAGVTGTICITDCQTKCASSGNWTPSKLCSFPLFANEECSGTSPGISTGCGYQIPAAVPNEGTCRKWSCGGSNTPSMDICIERCSDVSHTNCTNCNPFVCLQRDDTEVIQP